LRISSYAQHRPEIPAPATTIFLRVEGLFGNGFAGPVTPVEGAFAKADPARHSSTPAVAAFLRNSLRFTVMGSRQHCGGRHPHLAPPIRATRGGSFVGVLSADQN
jgi:hypothetical protein